MSKRTMLRLYIAFLACVAIALPILTYSSISTIKITPIDLLFWTVLVIWAELSTITLPKGGAALSVGGVIDCSILILFPTPIAAVYGAIAGITTSMKRRVDLERFVFNVSMFVITMSVSSTILEFANAKLYMIGASSSIDPASISSLFMPLFLPFVGAVTSYFLINTGLTSIAIAIKEGDSPVNVWNTNYKWTMPSAAAMGPIGLVIAVVYYLLFRINPMLAILGVTIFFLPTLIIRYAHRLFADVNKTYFNSIRALVTALDASHHYTQGHSMRVSQNAGLVAKHLRISDKEIETIQRGAMLHDIGKIGLDKSILDKPSSLSSQEWVQVKQHPVLGARIIGDLTFLGEAKDIVLYHHERMDGKGYPSGTTGQDIPVGARIVNALDALDALTSDRSYRRALTRNQALEMLEEKAGEQFDPHIVRAVVELAQDGALVFQNGSDDHEWESEIIFTVQQINDALNSHSISG